MIVFASLRSMAAADLVHQGPEIQVNSAPVVVAEVIPSVATFADGFVVTWSENVDWITGPPLRAEVMARLFDNAGEAVAPEFVVNTYTTGWQGFPVVDAWKDGFVIAWESDPMVGRRRSSVRGIAALRHWRFADQ